MALRTVACAVVMLGLAPLPRAAQPAAGDPPAITGIVLSPSGTPVTGGSVALMTGPTNRVTAAIDKAGRFRIVPEADGWQRFFIAAPGLAPYSADLNVPSSRKMALPPIALLEPTYFRARFVAGDGEPLPAGGLRRRMLDRDGLTIPDPLDHVQQHVDTDGTVTVGPLPRGRMLLGFDRAPLAPTRLADVTVAGSEGVIERGTIAIGPAATLQVDVVDGERRLVPGHDVWIEDAVQPSPLSFQPVKTNAQGRAVFDRLGPGRYRVWTRTVERCEGRQPLTFSRLVSATTTGATTRLMAGGRAILRVTTPAGPLQGRPVSASPDGPAEGPWRRPILAGLQWRGMAPPPASPPACGAASDAEGRVALAAFPPGPAQVRVQLFNSTFIARVSVPESGAEVAVAVPDGLIPVRVIDRTTRQPIPARLVWAGAGSRVEAAATASGDALLEAAGTGGGTLTISHRGYQTLEGVFEETPGTHQEVALSPLPASLVPVRVVDVTGAPIASAVVELTSAADMPAFATTNAQGMAFFNSVPPGALRFAAHADGLAKATVQVPEEDRAAIVITMKAASGGAGRR